MKKRTNFTKKSKVVIAFVFVSIFLFSTSITFAQNSDFSGIWTYNESKSKMPEMGFRMAASKITVSQDNLALKTERVSRGRDGEERITNESITLDGKECENVVFQDIKRISTAKWSTDEKSLIIQSSMTFERNGEKREIKSSETWNLSDDKSILTIEATSDSRDGEVKATLVYEKAK